MDESLITMVDNGINSGSYLYDLFWTNVGVRRSATETTQKVIQIDFRQKLFKCFYSERKAIKTQMDLTRGVTRGGAEGATAPPKIFFCNNGPQ